jgi:hypothetical protein
LATSPDPEQDERTADRLNWFERFAKDNGRDYDRQEWDEKLEACHARRPNDGHGGEVEHVGEAA